ncbi:MAG: hypothetical protein K2J20_02040, partial [Bacilli bacterium]|nr:hypothetical protein [Bacilli bacterium]
MKKFNLKKIMASGLAMLLTVTLSGSKGNLNSLSSSESTNSTTMETDIPEENIIDEFGIELDEQATTEYVPKEYKYLGDIPEFYKNQIIDGTDYFEDTLLSGIYHINITVNNNYDLSWLGKCIDLI